MLAAINDLPSVASAPKPEVLLWSLHHPASRRARVWTTDFDADDHIRDEIRTPVYYAFRRAGIVIPYPIVTNLFKEDMAPRSDEPAVIESALQAAQIFSAFSDAERAELGRTASQVLYAAGESIVREGEEGSSMFVVIRGEVVVTICTATRVAHLGPGDVFGEMSLLTGAPRSATVKAVRDTELLEITAEAFRRFVLANPATVEEIGLAVAARAAKLAEHRDAADAGSTSEADEPSTFLTRVRRFLRLSAV